VKLLLIYDVPGWAFHHIGTGLQKYAPDGCELTLVSHEGYYADYFEHPSACEPFDAAVALSIYTARGEIRPWFAFACSHAFRFATKEESDWRTRGVNPNRCESAARSFLSDEVDWVFACCSEVQEAFTRHADRVSLLPQGLDDTVFFPRKRNRSGKLRAGWCGQRYANFKGYAEILCPLMAQTSGKWSWEINRRGYQGARTPLQQAEWYRSLDLFVCTSIAEGGPLPPFEAAACGVPVLTTDVGSVKDWKMPEGPWRVKPYRDRRSARATVNRMAQVMSSFEPDPSLGREFAESIQRDWTWRVISPRWCAELSRLLATWPEWKGETL